jgi:hypothetical protein
MFSATRPVNGSGRNRRYRGLVAVACNTCAVRLSFGAVAAYRSVKTPNNVAQSLSPHVRKLACAGNADRLANDPEIIAQGVVASSRQAV